MSDIPQEYLYNKDKFSDLDMSERTYVFQRPYYTSVIYTASDIGGIVIIVQLHSPFHMVSVVLFCVCAHQYLKFQSKLTVQI